MVDYNALRKKFPTKDTKKRKRAAAIRAIAREYEMKRAALGGALHFVQIGRAHV